MAKKETKTNAMRILDTEGISYKVHTYDVSDGALDGVSVANKTGENPEQVYKTLVTIGDDRNHYVFVIPVAGMLDLKACARAAKIKNIEMIPQKELFPLTGYVHGGCSPIGMKKVFPTFYDETIILFETILVSGGKIGTQVEVGVEELIQVTNGTIAPLTRN